MKNKNNDNNDKIDDFLYNFYKQNQDIPHSTKLTIDNTIDKIFDKKKKKSNFNITILKRVAVVVLTVGIFTASTVFAKDIIEFLNRIFTNSHDGINSAVDNGYAQNVNMDFIVCNDIGIKVDYVLMDNNNLDISFVYKYYKDDVHLNDVNFTDLSITDENGNVLCTMLQDSLSNVDTSLVESSAIFNNNEIIDITTIRNSLLLKSPSFPTSKKLYININGVSLNVDDNLIKIDGTWNFAIDLNNNSVQKTSFDCNYNSPYITDVQTALTNTSLAITLRLNTLLDEMLITKYNSILLKDNFNINYLPVKVLSKNFQNNTSEIKLYFPITIYNTDINKLFLHIDITSDKSIDIEFFR